MKLPRAEWVLSSMVPHRKTWTADIASFLTELPRCGGFISSSVTQKNMDCWYYILSHWAAMGGGFIARKPHRKTGIAGIASISFTFIRWSHNNRFISLYGHTRVYFTVCSHKVKLHRMVTQGQSMFTKGSVKFHRIYTQGSRYVHTSLANFITCSQNANFGGVWGVWGVWDVCVVWGA